MQLATLIEDIELTAKMENKQREFNINKENIINIITYILSKDFFDAENKISGATAFYIYGGNTLININTLKTEQFVDFLGFYGEKLSKISLKNDEIEKGFIVYCFLEFMKKDSK